MKKVLSFFCLLFLFSTCQKEELSGPAENEMTSEVKVEARNSPPSQSGPYVFRRVSLINGLGFIYSDPKTGLTATHGVDNEAFCSSILDADVLPLQDVLSPSSDSRIIRLQKGDVQTFVYEGVFTGGLLCDFFDSAPLVATGIARINITDNDLVVFLDPDNKNSNAFTYKAHGKLTNADGEEVIFNGHVGAVWDGIDQSTFKQRSKVILK